MKKKEKKKIYADEWLETMGKHGNFAVPTDIEPDSLGKITKSSESIRKWKKKDKTNAAEQPKTMGKHGLLLLTMCKHTPLVCNIIVCVLHII